MRYRCPSCDEVSGEDICPRCNVLTEPWTDGADSPAVVLPPLPPEALPPDVPPPDVPAPDVPASEEEPEPRPSGDEARWDEEPLPSTAAGPESGEGASLISEASRQVLAQYVEDGYEIFLIVGIAAAGKTQMLDAYRRDPYLSSFVKKGGLAMPTAQGRLDCHPIQLGRRKVIFVDTSGEHFRDLYPMSPDDEIGERTIDFLRLLSGNLGGLVLLVDLRRLWRPDARNHPEDAAQVRILTWVLLLLRWLRQGGGYEEGPIPFQDWVNREVMVSRRRLAVPVLALFSRADELTGLPIPDRAPGGWPRQQGGPRTLLPVGEDPLLVAHHCVPELLAALTAHADHFRVDFAHSLVTDPDSGEVTDPQPCGLASSLRWLLDWSWRRRWRWLPSIPTRTWIALERFLDGTVRRSDRWRRLPDPVDVR